MNSRKAKLRILEFGTVAKWIRRIVTRRKFRFAAIFVIAIFIVVNLSLYLVYRNKTYPTTQLNNNNIGNIALNNLQQLIVEKYAHIDYEIALGNNKLNATAEEIGVSINYDNIVNSIQNNRHFIPLLNIFIPSKNYLHYDLNEDKFKKLINSKLLALQSDPLSQRIEKQDGNFVLKHARTGYHIDTQKQYTVIINQLNTGTKSLRLPSIKINAKEPTIDLTKELQKLNKSLDVTIQLTINDKKISIKRDQIYGFYLPKGETFVPSEKEIGIVIDGISKNFGTIANNRQELINQVVSSLNNHRNLVANIEPIPERTVTYTYCVATKGVSITYLDGFITKLASVYADNRGWNLGGKIKFIKVDSGCNFTAWLSSASMVPGFGSICDSFWSCRVGNNVIINFDRWSGASPAWNEAGGSLDDYRSMVINHETGHWFGFYHRYCPGSGQPAPIMQQQSISLQGCTFNAWPTISELNSLTSSVGL